MEVCFLASGERVAVLDAAELEGTTAKTVKHALATKLDVTTFRQRLFLEGDAGEIHDDDIFPSVPLKVQLVVLEFCPPDAEEDEELMSAARDNDTAGLEQLLKRPRNPNTRDRHGQTPLHHAAEHGHVEPMRLLLEAGAEIDAPGSQRFGEAPLHWAAEGGHLEAVRFLVQNGAQKDVLDCNGRTPLGFAATRGHVDIARFLVLEGANKEQLVTGNALIGAAGRGRLEMVLFLVAVGCDKDQTNEIGATPLYYAARNGHSDIVRFLAESGASRHSMTEFGRTALDVASERGHEEVVRFLSEFEAESPPQKLRRLNSPDAQTDCWGVR